MDKSDAKRPTSTASWTRFQICFSIFPRPERKNIAWMNDIICKFTLPCGLVVECCAGKFSGYKALCFYSGTSSLSGVTWTWSMSLLVSRNWPSHFVCQVLNMPNITAENDVPQAASTNVEAIEELDLRRFVSVREKPAGFSTTQTFLLHKLYHVSIYHTEYSLYDQAQKFLTNLWTREWRWRLDMFDVCSLLAVNCGAFGVKTKASNISRDSVGCCTFSDRLFGAGEIEGCYYGTLVYSNLTTEKQVWKTYREYVMFVTAHDFSLWAFKVAKTFLHRTEKERIARIVPAHFCCMQFIDDSRYRPGIKSTEIQRHPKQ